MKISIKNYSGIFNLLGSILFLILGAIMYTKPSAVVIFTTYIFGGLLIVVGLFKCIKNYLDVKKDNEVSSNEMIIGIVMAVLGVVCIFLAGVVEALVRLVIGGWMIFSGINSLINALSLDKRTSKFIISLIISIIIIGGGLYTILKANLEFQVIGIVLMAYAVLEIIKYIFNHNSKAIVKIKPNIEGKVIDAELVEKKDKKKKGSKN